jgi:hypothetical protein
MSEAAYHIATREELAGRDICDEYDTLLGPDGFECVLTEPEDRFWYRDASPAITRLNEQHAEIERLREMLSHGYKAGVSGE